MMSTLCCTGNAWMKRIPGDVVSGGGGTGGGRGRLHAASQLLRSLSLPAGVGKQSKLILSHAKRTFGVGGGGGGGGAVEPLHRYSAYMVPFTGILFGYGVLFNAVPRHKQIPEGVKPAFGTATQTWPCWQFVGQYPV